MVYCSYTMAKPFDPPTHHDTNIYTTLTLKIKGNHRCIYLLSWQRESDISRRHGNRIYLRYIPSSWQWGSHMFQCCGNMPGYISGGFHFWSIACMTSSLYYMQFNKCICNLTSEYSFNCGFNFFLICLTWCILKWYISLITWAIGICLIYMPTPSGLRPSG